MPARARFRSRCTRRPGLWNSTPSSAVSEKLPERNHSRARRAALEPVIDLVNIAPALDQRHAQRWFEGQVARKAPFAFIGPVQWRISLHFQAYHAPLLGGGNNRPGLPPRQIDHRTRAHPESIAPVHGNTERLITAAILAHQHGAELRQGNVEQAYHRPSSTHHPPSAPHHT